MTADTPDEAARKQAFERDKVCYEQNFQQYRAMNQIMWQVPLLAITITGGLWYAALGVSGASAFRGPLFLLSAVLENRTSPRRVTLSGACAGRRAANSAAKAADAHQRVTWDMARSEPSVAAQPAVSKDAGRRRDLEFTPHGLGNGNRAGVSPRAAPIPA